MKDLLPTEFHLSQNYPNPFKEETRIEYCVPYQCRVTLTIYDSEDMLLEQIVDEEKQAGTYELVWNGRDLPCGTYLCRMKAGNFGQTKKMSLTGASK